MNPLHSSIASNLDAPLLHDEAISLPKPKNKRFFLSELISSEENLSASIIKFYNVLSSARLQWLYQQLLSMRFDKSLVQYILKQNSCILDYNYTREELLNRVIDLYNAKENENENEKNENLGSFNNVGGSFLSQEQEESKETIIKTKKRANSYSLNSYYSNNEVIQEMDLEGNLNICRICYLISDNIITIKNCSHKFCSDCVRSFIKSKIEHYDTRAIGCPSEECGNILKEEFIKETLKNEPKLFEKYLKFKAQQDLLEYPNRKWCIKPDCPHYVEKTSLDDDKIICKCGQEMCFACGNAWHEGISCEEAVDKDYIEYEKNVMVKKCPKCLAKIEKNEGCNHITCTRCKYEFCWVCRAVCVNGYCINNCPKFPVNELRRRGRVINFLQRNFFCECHFQNQMCSLIILKISFNLIFFIIFSNLLIYTSCILLLGLYIDFIIFSQFSLFHEIMIRPYENLQNSNCRKIFFIFFSPILFLSFIWLSLLALLFFILGLPLFLILNIAKYMFISLFDRTAFSIFYYERRLTLLEVNINSIPAEKRILFFVFSIIYLSFIGLLYLVFIEYLIN